MDATEIREYLQTAEEAARLGGRILLDWTERFTVSEKSRADLVTEADVASQQAIHELIRERYPDHGFLGEEGLSEPRGPSGCRWIIDPLDGTSNYVHGFPYYCVSIGLQQADELIAGVIYDPNRDELFRAGRGLGAWRDGRPIRVTRTGSLAEAMAVASLPRAVSAEHPSVRRFLAILPRARALQRTGSAALNLAYVACGRLDVYWSSSLKPWDMAAGALLVTEAGGRVTKLDGSAFRVDQKEILATNGTALHDETAAALTV